MNLYRIRGAIQIVKEAVELEANPLALFWTLDF